jgi:thiol-disulfide isomerase/thioredoxin
MASGFKHIGQLTPYLPYIFVILFAGTVLCALGYCFSGREGFQATDSLTLRNPTFRMYYADWCPHCVTTKPELLKLGSTQTIGGTTVLIEKMEEKDIPAAVKPTIQGYPTIRLLNPDGTTKAEYEGPRTSEGFLQFLNAQYA